MIERTNTYIVKQFFSFHGLSQETQVWGATSAPIVQPPGWSLPGGHLKAHKAWRKGGGAAAQRLGRGRGAGVCGASGQGSRTRLLSSPGKQGSLSSPGGRVMALTAGTGAPAPVRQLFL